MVQHSLVSDVSYMGFGFRSLRPIEVAVFENGGFLLNAVDTNFSPIYN